MHINVIDDTVMFMPGIADITNQFRFMVIHIKTLKKNEITIFKIANENMNLGDNFDEYILYTTCINYYDKKYSLSELDQLRSEMTPENMAKLEKSIFQCL